MKTTKKITLSEPLKSAHLNGLGEIPVLFYGIAKENDVKQGDVIAVITQVGTVQFNDVFTVGSYVKEDKFGRRVSGFALLN